MTVRQMSLIILLLFPTLSFATGIAVTSVSIASQNTTEKYKMVKLNVAWSNSWRTYNYESNYDAAWIFIKYRRLSGGPWLHATLNYVNGTADGHVKATSSDINTPSDGKGVFVFRANTSPTNFIGAASYSNMQVRWNYGVDGLADTELVEISVFAIEVVYIPQGAFYLGDGVTGTSGVTSARFQDGASTSPFYVTSENQLTLGGTTAGNLSNPTVSFANKDDFSVSLPVQTLPAAYPKGFKAIYCMKYEVSQEQYAEFLKKLTPTQAATHYDVQYYGRFRYTIDATFTAGVPDRACNFLTYSDMLAYADWSGLRPMSELEFEKICRGPVYPVPNEFPWGTTTYRILAGIANDGTPSETDNNSPRANLHISHGTGYNNESDPLYGPMRCGWTVGGSRELAGDTYYGVSDMAGNVEEMAISCGYAISRAFSGTNGDGVLAADGSATNSDWPLAANSRAKYKGGSIFGSSVNIERSYTSRRSDNYDNVERFPFYGFRAVRSVN